jgi:hypothetical protein
VVICTGKVTLVTRGPKVDFTYATKVLVRHIGGEKEAGPAGGESGARAHGLALGGEASAVLMEAYPTFSRSIDQGGEIPPRVSNSLMQLQPIELQHTGHGLNRVVSKLLPTSSSDFH